MSLHVVLWPCMQFNELACSYMSLHAVPFFVWAAHKNFAVLVLVDSHNTADTWNYGILLDGVLQQTLNMCSIKMHHLMSDWRDLVSGHCVVWYPCSQFPDYCAGWPALITSTGISFPLSWGKLQLKFFYNSPQLLTSQHVPKFSSKYGFWPPISPLIHWMNYRDTGYQQIVGICLKNRNFANCW